MILGKRRSTSSWLADARRPTSRQDGHSPALRHLDHVLDVGGIARRGDRQGLHLVDRRVGGVDHPVSAVGTHLATHAATQVGGDRLNLNFAKVSGASDSRLSHGCLRRFYAEAMLRVASTVYCRSGFTAPARLDGRRSRADLKA